MLTVTEPTTKVIADVDIVVSTAATVNFDEVVIQGTDFAACPIISYELTQINYSVDPADDLTFNNLIMTFDATSKLIDLHPDLNSDVDRGDSSCNLAPNGGIADKVCHVELVVDARSINGTVGIAKEVTVNFITECMALNEPTFREQAWEWLVDD